MRRVAYDRLPRVKITDLLLEVDSWTGFDRRTGQLGPRISHPLRMAGPEIRHALNSIGRNVKTGYAISGAGVELDFMDYPVPEKPLVARRPGRPSKSEENAITKAILDAARAQFMARGLAGAIMEGIAAEAGVSRNTLYTRYPTKDTLFAAVVDDLFARWAKKRPGLRRNGDESPSGVVRRTCRSIALNFTSNEWVEHQALMAAAGEQAPLYRKKSYENGYHKLAGMLEKDIGVLLASSPSDRREAGELTTVIIAALIGWRELEQQDRNTTRAEAVTFADRLVNSLRFADD